MRLLLTLLLAAAPLAARAAPQDFTVVNHTGYRIDGIYVSQAGRGEWGNDVLGIDFIRDGERARIGFAPDEPSCVWDLQVRYHDNTRAVWRRINICEVRRIGLYYDLRQQITVAKVE